MIVYGDGIFGIDALYRVHGSATFKGVLPSLISTGMFLILAYSKGDAVDLGDINDDERLTQHPYTLFTAFFMFFAFLLAFRLNWSYGRYWEGCTAIHLMQSKWLDTATNVASYHYTSAQFDKLKPLSFGEHSELRNVTLTRERQSEPTEEEVIAAIEAANQSNLSRRRLPDRQEPPVGPALKKTIQPSANVRRSQKSANLRDISDRDAQIGSDAVIGKGAFLLGGSTGQKTRPPSLFLQELAHLFSLLSAVAMSTLRNDVEGAESPLVPYREGRPFPPVDPDKLEGEIRREFDSTSSVWTAVYFLLGLNHGHRRRTLYNAARPFRVLGGVSDDEIQALQEAHGPYAKVSLCSMWVYEFISREHLAGSTGGVPPPIVSRVYQFLSDGMKGYNQIRNIAYVSFPFPHAQIATFFSLVIIFIFPCLFFSFVNHVVLGAVLNFTTVLCFLGLHEVSRELEDPTKNAPNDLPFNNFQSQFNEALITMYAGFHPDSWWDASELKEKVEADLVANDIPEEEETKEEEEETKGEGDDGEVSIAELLDSDDPQDKRE